MPSEWGDTERDRVAKAIYDTQVKQAREQIDRLTFDPQEIEDLARRLQKESQRRKSSFPIPIWMIAYSNSSSFNFARTKATPKLIVYSA